MRRDFAIRAVAAGVGLLALSGTALAQTQAYTNAPVDIYAGPAPDYPIVAQVQEGSELTVLGCVQDYSWCDVAAPGLRGWAYGGYLSYPYQGTEVPVMTYGATIGLPIVAFSIDSYWGSHYRDRPWYRDEPRWANHRPPERGVRPPESRDMDRAPAPRPEERQEPTYGRAPEAPPVRGGPPPTQPQSGYARPMEQPSPRAGGPQPQPRPQMQPQPQVERGVRPGAGPSRAEGGPAMRPGPGAMPAPGGRYEERGNEAGAGGEPRQEGSGQSNH